MEEEETVWIRAAYQVLVSASRPLHYTEIKCEILQKALVAPGLKTTLDAALVKHGELPNQLIMQVKDKPGYYARADISPVKVTTALSPKREPKQTKLKTPNRKPVSKLKSPETSEKRAKKSLKRKATDQGVKRDKSDHKSFAQSSPRAKAETMAHNISKYEVRYRRLKRLAKDLIFINAAYCDEIVDTEKQISKAKEERKFLLTRVLQRKSLAEAQPPAPIKQPPQHKPSQSIAQILGAVEKKVKRKQPTPSTKLAVKSSKQASEECGKAKVRKRRPSVAESSRVLQLDETGNPVLPVQLGHLAVCNLGSIVTDRPGYHTADHLYPVGYQSVRRYLGLSHQRPTSVYTCSIRDNGLAPLFEIEAETDKHLLFRGNSPGECHSKLLFAISQARGREILSTGDRGAEFFGISHPVIQHLLQNQPQAKKCTKYKHKKFDTTQLNENYIEPDPTVNMDVVFALENSSIASVENGHFSKADKYSELSLMAQPLTVDTLMTHAGSAILVPVIPNG